LCAKLSRTSDLVVIEVEATHLYPGARGRLGDLAGTSNNKRTIVIFADNATAAADLTWCSNDEALLIVSPYRTARKYCHRHEDLASRI
jgi:hypothetical protein